MTDQPTPTLTDGYEALRRHVTERAAAARRRHGALHDEAAVRRLLADPEVVRFPTALVFDDEPLLAGEFAWPRPRGDRPADGYDLVVHPAFRERPDVLPLLVAYHVPAINYLDVVTHVEAELFGATLLGLDVDDYYQRLCALADSLPASAGGAASVTAPVGPAAWPVFAAAFPSDDQPATQPKESGSGGCGGNCSCAGGRP